MWQISSSLPSSSSVRRWQGGGTGWQQVENKHTQSGIQKTESRSQKSEKFPKTESRKSFYKKITEIVLAWKDFLKYTLPKFDSTRRIGRCSIGCSNIPDVLKNGQKKPSAPLVFGSFSTHLWPYQHPIEYLPILLVLSNSGKMYFRKSFQAKKILVIFWWKLFSIFFFEIFFCKIFLFFEF